jgi:hypothetical protein
VTLSSTANEITINSTKDDLDLFLGTWIRGHNQTLSPARLYQGLAYDGARYVAVGTDFMDFSVDGVYYKAASPSGLPSTRDNIFFLNDKFYMTSLNSSTIYRNSSVNINSAWTAITAMDNIKGMAYGAGKYVACGLSNPHILYSSDGVTWTGVPGLVAGVYGSVVYTGTEFIALGNVFTPDLGFVARSSDGVTWVESAVSGADGYFKRMAYGNGILAAVGNNYTRPLQCVYSTNNGATWQSSNIINAGLNWEDIIYIPTVQAFFTIRQAFVGSSVTPVATDNISGAFTKDFINWKYITLPRRQSPTETAAEAVTYFRMALGQDRISIVGSSGSTTTSGGICASPVFRFIT